MSCTTHHNACDCREAYFKMVIEERNNLNRWWEEARAQAIRYHEALQAIARGMDWDLMALNQNHEGVLRTVERIARRALTEPDRQVNAKISGKYNESETLSENMNAKPASQDAFNACDQADCFEPRCRRERSSDVPQADIELCIMCVGLGRKCSRHDGTEGKA